LAGPPASVVVVGSAAVLRLRSTVRPVKLPTARARHRMSFAFTGALHTRTTLFTRGTSAALPTRHNTTMSSRHRTLVTRAALTSVAEVRSARTRAMSLLSTVSLPIYVVYLLQSIDQLSLFADLDIAGGPQGFPFDDDNNLGDI
jgi:hypothetical protein